MAYYKVKDHAGLVRDSASNAILNTNMDAYHAAKLRKRKRIQSQREIAELKQEVNTLKELVQELINNKNEFRQDKH